MGLRQTARARKERLVDKAQRSPPGTLWVYAYEFARLPEENQLNAIRALLDREHTTARRTARKWTGKLVCEQRVTHILVVSDSPDQSREVNHRLESRLKLLQAKFSVTVPMSLPDDEAPSPDGRAAALPTTPS
jgi:hypothetical protein